MILDGLITGYWSWCIWEWNGLFNYTVWPPQSGVVLRLFMEGFHFAKSGYTHSNGSYVCSKSETWLESSGLRTTYCHQWKRSPTYFGIRFRKTRFPFMKNDMFSTNGELGNLDLQKLTEITIPETIPFTTPSRISTQQHGCYGRKRQRQPRKYKPQAPTNQL